MLFAACIAFLAGSAAASDLETEKAAAVVYKTGMALLENDAAPREEAMKLFQQVLLQYPTSEAAKWAELRAAICLYYLQRYRDAADACQVIIDKYPGELVAAWAQFHKALAINDLGNYAAAAQEFAKVEEYANLPDHGPIDYARHRAGRTFAELERKIGYKATLATFGVDPQDTRKMAWTFMIWAIARVTTADFGFADIYFNELRTRYPEFTDYAAAAAAEIGSHTLDYLERDRQTSEKAINYLLLPRQLHPQDTWTVTKAELRLASHYMSIMRDYPTAQQLLQNLVDTAPDCDLANEVRYRLAQCLVSRKAFADAAYVYAAICADNPLSGWAESAGYMRGCCLLSAGDATQAKSVLEETANSEAITAYWRLAARKKLIQAYISTGDKQRAKQLLEEDLALLRQTLADCRREGDSDRAARLEKSIQALSERAARLVTSGGGQQR